MKTIAYTGTADFQVFDKNDFAKAGVENGKNFRFAQKMPTEVEDEIAEVLLSKDGLFGDHQFTDLTDVEEGDTAEETEQNQIQAAEKQVTKTAKKAARASTSTPPTSGPEATAQSAGGAGTAGTGRGTSTGGPTT